MNRQNRQNRQVLTGSLCAAGICYAGSGISSPSRSALMTGRNTGNTRIRDNMCTAGGIAGIKVNPGGDSTIVRRANLMPQTTRLTTIPITAFMATR